MLKLNKIFYKYNMNEVIKNLKGSYFMVLVALIVMWGFLKFFDSKEVTLQNGEKAPNPHTNMHHLRNIIVTCLLVAITVFINSSNSKLPTEVIKGGVSIRPAPF